MASLAKFASSGGDDADGNSKSFRRDALINDLVVVRNCIRVGLPLFPELADDAADLYAAPSLQRYGRGRFVEFDEYLLVYVVRMFLAYSSTRHAVIRC